MRRWSAILTFVFVVVVGLSALGQREDSSWSGTLSVVGNMPFAHLVLTDLEGRQWRLSGAAVDTLVREGQGRRVRLVGARQSDGTILIERWEWIAEENKP